MDKVGKRKKMWIRCGEGGREEKGVKWEKQGNMDKEGGGKRKGIRI